MSETTPDPSMERAKTAPFRDLFPASELRLYAAGAAVYCALALFLRDAVLNWIIGPLFITVWAWYVPVFQERWRGRRGRR